MISILENLAASVMIPMGFVIDDIILLSKTYIGFIVVFSLLIFLEYLTVESIIKDPNRIKLRMVLNYIKSYRLKDVSLISPQWAVLNIISKKKNICVKKISDNTGETIGDTKKIISGLVYKGYVACKIGINDERTFCHIIF